MQKGEGLVIKPTHTQKRGWLPLVLGSLATSIFSKLLGFGMNFPQVYSKGKGKQFPEVVSKGGAMMFPSAPPFYQPPYSVPFKGMGHGRKGSKRQRPALKQKLTIQINSDHWRYPLRDTLNKPLSNLNIDAWYKFLKIDRFGGILAHDQILNAKSNCYYVCNFHDSRGDGSHWFSFIIRNDISETFNSYGTHLVEEFIQTFKKICL